MKRFQDQELDSLYQVWLDQRAVVDEKTFAAELAREWSIETGIIEGVYTLDRGTSEILIRRGIDSSYIARESTNRQPDVVAQIISDHEDVLEGLFDFVAQRRALTTSYIKELQAALLRHQETVKGVDQFGTEIYVELKRGEHKRHPNSPTRRDKAVHEYCPPEHVASEMDRLVEFHRLHEQRSVPALVEASWLHHAFTQIHPFQDGNGRVARALASLVLVKARLFPLVVRRDDWEKYIDALEATDEGDLLPLVTLFARLQKRDLTRAITIAADAKPAKSVDEAVTRTRDLLVNLNKIVPAEYARSTQNAQRLFQLALARFKQVATMLTNEIGQANADMSFGSGGVSIDAAVLKELAEKFHYQPNPMEESLNSALVMSARGVIARFVVSFNPVGVPFRGIVAAAAYFRVGDGPIVPLADDIFRIDHREGPDALQDRFQKWLEDCLVKGLAEWRKTLL